jgi:type IV pilus assembly protein PilC
MKNYLPHKLLLLTLLLPTTVWSVTSSAEQPELLPNVQNEQIALPAHINLEVPFTSEIPVIGNLIKEVNAARTARSLSSLVNSGVDVLESIKITTDIVQNVHYKRVLQDAAVSVEKGEPISKIFTQNDKLYPLFLGEMISVGEETGKIGEMLLGVAVYYEEDVDQKTKDMSTIIEPVLMVFIAAAVGFFAVAMISPMYSLVNSL